jgi:hypothetical protein
MKFNPSVILVLLCFLLNISDSQTQNILILERPGTIKYFKYEVNDWIKLSTSKPDTTIHGFISLINDSSITIDRVNEVTLKNISTIIRKRWGFNFLQKLFITAGIPYLLISTINGVINNDEPVVPTETLIISGSLIAAAIVVTPLTSRKHKTDNKKWRVKILDFTD